MELGPAELEESGDAGLFYETSKNVRFMTYAEYWIKQSVQQYLENCGSTVRIPAQTRAKISCLRRATSQLRQNQGREPTATEIAALLGVPVEEVQEIQGYMQSVVSLDTPITEPLIHEFLCITAENLERNPFGTGS